MPIPTLWMLIGCCGYIAKKRRDKRRPPGRPPVSSRRPGSFTTPPPTDNVPPPGSLPPPGVVGTPLSGAGALSIGPQANRRHRRRRGRVKRN